MRRCLGSPVSFTGSRLHGKVAMAVKVRVVTGQPKKSYEIVDGGPDSKSSKLAVKDPSAFWKGDKYLVVMIPD